MASIKLLIQQYIDSDVYRGWISTNTMTSLYDVITSAPYIFNFKSFAKNRSASNFLSNGIYNIMF